METKIDRRSPIGEAVLWQTFGLEMQSGMPILQALNILGQAFPAYGEEITGIHDAIKEGESLSLPMQKYQRSFHPLMHEFMLVGEETGSLPETLVKGGQLVASEFKTRLKNSLGIYTQQNVAEILFFEYLTALTEIGFPLLRSLRRVGEVAEKPYRAASRGLAESVESGSTFAESLAAQKFIFSPFQINMVKAGEAGGVLEVILGRLTDHLKYSYDLRGRYANLDQGPNIDQT